MSNTNENKPLLQHLSLKAPSCLILCTHPEVKPLLQPYHFGDGVPPAVGDRSQSTEYYYLLLDRETRKLYVGEGEVVESCLTEPQTLALLASLDSLLAVPMTNNTNSLKSGNRFKPPNPDTI